MVDKASGIFWNNSSVLSCFSLAVRDLSYVLWCQINVTVISSYFFLPLFLIHIASTVGLLTKPVSRTCENRWKFTHLWKVYDIFLFFFGEWNLKHVNSNKFYFVVLLQPMENSRVVFAIVAYIFVEIFVLGKNISFDLLAVIDICSGKL